VRAAIRLGMQRVYSGAVATRGGSGNLCQHSVSKTVVIETGLLRPPREGKLSGINLCDATASHSPAISRNSAASENLPSRNTIRRTRGTLDDLEVSYMYSPRPSAAVHQFSAAKQSLCPIPFHSVTPIATWTRHLPGDLGHPASLVEENCLMQLSFVRVLVLIEVDETDSTWEGTLAHREFYSVNR
jgi:hypothetical protein